MWVVYEQVPRYRSEKRIAMMDTKESAEKEAARLNHLEQYKERELSKFIVRQEPDNAA